MCFHTLLSTLRLRCRHLKQKLVWDEHLKRLAIAQSWLLVWLGALYFLSHAPDTPSVGAGLHLRLPTVHIRLLDWSDEEEPGSLPCPWGVFCSPMNSCFLSTARVVLRSILQTSGFQLISLQKETAFWQGVGGAAQRCLHWGQITVIFSCWRRVGDD